MDNARHFYLSREAREPDGQAPDSSFLIPPLTSRECLDVEGLWVANRVSILAAGRICVSISLSCFIAMCGDHGVDKTRAFQGKLAAPLLGQQLAFHPRSLQGLPGETWQPTRAS